MDRLDPGRGEHEADEHGAGHGSGEAEAAEAFEALRAEVAGLGRGLERLDALVRRGQREQAEAREDAPDYSPTLGAMAKELAEARERLAAIEGQPALKLTPSGFQAELKTAVGAAALASGVELQAATRRAEALAGMGDADGAARLRLDAALPARYGFGDAGARARAAEVGALSPWRHGGPP